MENCFRFEIKYLTHVLYLFHELTVDTYFE